MTVVTIKVKVQRKNIVKLKVIPRFPSSVSVQSPMLLDRTGGSFNFSLSVTALRTIFDSIYTSVPLPFASISGTISLAQIADNSLTNVKSAQMAANTVKCNPSGALANAQDSTSPVITTLTALSSFIGPVLSGGGAANSQLVIQSTFGAGTTDSIVFQTGSQVQRGGITSAGSFIWSTGTAAQPVKPYDGITQTGVSAWNIVNSDSAGLTATERYTAWVSNTSAGTGDGSVAGTTYALGVSNIKLNWTTSGVPGQTIGLLVTARGGYNNVVSNGDTAAINVNAGASYSNNLSQQFEGVSGYFPVGSASGSIVINAQIGSIRATGLGDVGNNVSYGYFAQARNGASGVAFGASNLKASPQYGNAATWGYFLKYDNDDGTHTAYTSFAVAPSGALTIAGFGAVGTNQKTIRVGGSVTNNLEIVNGASSALIFSMTDTGLMQVGPGSTTANGAVATAMSSLGPAGSHTTIQEWFMLQNSSGVTRYIPAF